MLKKIYSRSWRWFGLIVRLLDRLISTISPKFSHAGAKLSKLNRKKINIWHSNNIVKASNGIIFTEYWRASIIWDDNVKIMKEQKIFISIVSCGNILMPGQIQVLGNLNISALPWLPKTHSKKPRTIGGFRQRLLISNGRTFPYESYESINYIFDLLNNNLNDITTIINVRRTSLSQITIWNYGSWWWVSWYCQAPSSRKNNQKTEKQCPQKISTSGYSPY